jgi:hypothetical protein
MINNSVCYQPIGNTLCKLLHTAFEDIVHVRIFRSFCMELFTP